MFSVKRDNPKQDYLDYLTRATRNRNVTRLEVHGKLLSKETAFSYGLTLEQYDEITVVLKSEV